MEWASLIFLSIAILQVKLSLEEDMKYPLDESFAFLQKAVAPSSESMLRAANFLMDILPKKTNSDDEMTVQHIKITADDGEELTAYLYEPAELKGDAPCLVYIHGGGFTTKAAPMYYSCAWKLAESVPCKLLFADYRMALDYPFPTPAEDCYATLKWAFDHAAEYQIDPSRIAIGGDSAGGNLAAGVSLMARDRGLTMPCFMMLLYPVLDRRMQTESMRLFSDTPMWNSVLNKQMWDYYLPNGADTPNLEYASPAEASSLAGLPTAYIETAEFDCLRDEGIAFAAALKAAGVPVQHREVDGAPHGYDVAMRSPVTRACMEQRIENLRKAFGINEVPYTLPG